MLFGRDRWEEEGSRALVHAVRRVVVGPLGLGLLGLAGPGGDAVPFFLELFFSVSKQKGLGLKVLGV